MSGKIDRRANCDVRYGVQHVWIDEHMPVPSTQTIVVDGVNGCTAAIFFGNGHVLGAHLSAANEEAAVEAGTTDTVVIRAPTSTVKAEVQAVIAALLPPATIHSQTYPFRYRTADCLELKVAAGTQSVVETWEKSGN
ncbi:hypothetical protein SEUCBS139899_001842 [Sporothrix eucalyptigena]|uniref:Uncharacterized protein n=1 Tax=Sporothrix eucalyptigena TaxID=1812306 RepID=A0ABP0CMB8_9PEZI